MPAAVQRLDDRGLVLVGEAGEQGAAAAAALTVIQIKAARPSRAMKPSSGQALGHRRLGGEAAQRLADAAPARPGRPPERGGTGGEIG